MRAVERRCALVPLDTVFFFRGKVVRVGVCGAAENDVRGGGGEGRVDGGGLDGVAPAAAGHGGCFAGADDHDKLTDPEE